MEVSGQMPQPKKVDFFTIEWKSRNLPVDVYRLGEQTNYKVTFGDATELHLYWNGKQWSGRGIEVYEPFIQLIEKHYPQFPPQSALSCK